MEPGHPSPKEEEAAKAAVDESRQRERLEKEVRAMHEQFSQLKALLDTERKSREKARAEAENELKEVRAAFEGTIWTKVGLEEEVKKMEKETFFLTKMLEELSSSTNGSDGIEEKIENLESQTTTKVEEREFLARVLKRLQDQTRVMRNTLDLHIQGKNANYTDLESKRNELRRKLRARGDVERVIMELEDEVESLKAQIKREEKAREQQEWLVDVEINDLSKRHTRPPHTPRSSRHCSLARLTLLVCLRLELEIKAREKTQSMIEQATAQRKKLVQEVEALKVRSASPAGIRDAKEGVRNEFRKSFHPAAFHRTQSGTAVEEKKDDEPQTASLSSSFSPIRESSPPLVSGEIVFKGGDSLTSRSESDGELSDLPFTRNLQDLQSRMDEVWEAMTEEADKSRGLERELKQMHAAVEEEREERRQLAQVMAAERERREELERKLSLLLDLQSGTNPAQ